jgi:hypothetical protein
MELYGDEWGRKGATLSDKTARAEFGLTQDEIIAAIRAGLLEWERPLHDHLPELWLHDPVVTDRLSVMDLNAACASPRSVLASRSRAAVAMAPGMKAEPRYLRLSAGYGRQWRPQADSPES